MEDTNLEKSMDELIDQFLAQNESGDTVEKAEKDIEVYRANKTKADDVVNAAPTTQDDAARGAGRPKEIHDVPKNDQDGEKSKDYDEDITMNEGKEDEPDEAKKQSKVMDQSKDDGRMSSKPKAPEMRPFKKSIEMDEDEYADYIEFKKSKELEKAKKMKKMDEMKEKEDGDDDKEDEKEDKQEKKEMKKSESAFDSSQEDLIKAAVSEAVGSLKKENEDLRKAFNEQSEMLKSIASKPVDRKSITSNVEALEKSVNDEAQPTSFSKSEILDATEELVKSKKMPMDVASEIEMTGTVYNQEYKKMIEDFLTKNR